MKHTPGPWAIEVDKTGEVTVYEAVTLQNVDICKLGGNTNDGSNARLIAAAPNLLAAAQAMVAVFAVGFESGASPAVDYARAAIAKAKAQP